MLKIPDIVSWKYRICIRYISPTLIKYLSNFWTSNLQATGRFCLCWRVDVDVAMMLDDEVEVAASNGAETVDVGVMTKVDEGERASSNGVETDCAVCDFPFSIQSSTAHLCPSLNTSSVRSASCKRRSWWTVIACPIIDSAHDIIELRSCTNLLACNISRHVHCVSKNISPLVVLE